MSRQAFHTGAIHELGKRVNEESCGLEALTARFREALDRELAALPDEAVPRDRIEERVEGVQTRSGRELPPRSLERPPDAPANRAVGPAGAGQGHLPSPARVAHRPATRFPHAGADSRPIRNSHDPSFTRLPNSWIAPFSHTLYGKRGPRGWGPVGTSWCVGPPGGIWMRTRA